MKFKKKTHNLKLRICICVTIVFVLLSVFRFPFAGIRLFESFRDFGTSIGFYFCELFEISHSIMPSVNSYSKAPFVLPFSIPNTWSEFKLLFCSYWKAFCNKENLVAYLLHLSDGAYIVSQALLIIVPLLFIIFILLRRNLEKENNDYNVDSRPLVQMKSFADVVYIPVKKNVISFFNYVRDNRVFPITWLCIWCFNFNFFSIIIEAFSYYFYFVVSFDFINLYRQLYKLLLDLSVCLDYVPLWLWSIIAIIAVDFLRKKIAYSRLNHLERKNRGFINARPIVAMICGTMGKKKTTALTDMALSQEAMFRYKAFEKILENDLKFPFFPWINLENELKRAMRYHSVYNLASCRIWVQKKRLRWSYFGEMSKVFDYDYNRYGLTYDDNLKVVTVWDVIEIYAQLYFIYIIQSSLLISNYSVRTDNILMDQGNFPLWDTDFFRRDSRLIDAYSRHAHILDFDTLRLGKKVIEHNQLSNSFEFGVVLITEVGKERGNNLELTEKKKNDKFANQKNDLFNSMLKMIRHSATVDNFPFVRVLTDEQRPESWGADARDLCEIVHIRESGETSLAMPFFFIEELIYDLIFGRFVDLYSRYRFVRSDNTLTMHLLKKLASTLNHHYIRTYNRFGFCPLRVQLESGTQDGDIEENTYYLMSKKIYSKRFSTDCFSDFFTEKALRSSVGIEDICEYSIEKASFAELERQNSYFVMDLLTGLRSED